MNEKELKVLILDITEREFVEVALMSWIEGLQAESNEDHLDEFDKFVIQDGINICEKILTKIRTEAK